mgnify:CR=1 FL=1
MKNTGTQLKLQRTINNVQNFKPIKEGVNRKHLELISVVENGYRDLKRLGIEQEIKTSMTEKKLPEDIKNYWAKIVNSDANPADRANKFPTWTKFLLSQKNITEYKVLERRATTLPAKITTHYTGIEDKPQKFANCIFHDKRKHWTSDCRLFIYLFIYKHLGT